MLDQTALIDALQRENAALRQRITELEQSEAALHETAADLRAVFNATDETILLVEADGTLLAVNDAAAQRLGRSRADLLGRNIVYLLPPEVAARRRPFFDRVLLSGEPVTLEDQHNDYWEFSRVYPVLNAAGQVSRLAIFARDITARKQLEETLAFQASLLDQVHNAVIVIDLSNKIIFWNRFAEDLYQWTRAEALGRDIIELLSPTELLDTVHQNFAALNHDGHWEGEFTVKRKDGRTLPAHITNTYLKDSRGTVTGFIGISVDVTRRKQAEEALRAIQNRYQLVFEHSGTVNSIFDTDCRLIMQNSLSIQNLGLTREEALGKTALEIFGPQRGPVVTERMQRVLASGLPESFETEFNLLTGTKWFRSVYQPIFDEPDRLLGIQVISQDITDRKRIEEALQASEAKYRLLFDNMQEAFSLSEIIIDEHGQPIDFRILDANAASEQHMGLRPADIIGKTAREVLPPLDPQRMQLFYRIASTGEPQVLEYYSEPFKRYFRLRGFSPQRGRVAIVLEDITDRKQAEAALRQSEANLRASEHNFRTFFESSNQLLFVLDEQGCILFSNVRVTNRLGYTSDELRGQSILLVHPPERRAEAGQIVADMLAGRADYCPVPLQTKDGRQLPVETRVFSGEWNGQPALLGVTTDLSALQASEEKFAKAFEASPLLMALSDFNTGRYLDVNFAFLDTLGYMRDEVIGQSPRDLNLFQYSAQRDRALERLAREGYLRDFEVQVVTRTGQIRHGSFSAEVLQLQDQQVLLTIMSDITDRKQMEEALRQSEQRWSFALEGAGDGVWDTDIPAGRSYFSPQWKAMLGYADHEIGDATSEWTDRVHPDDLSVVVGVARRHTDGDTPIYQSEYRMRAKDGTYRWVLSRGKVISRTPDGQPWRVIGTHSDITERKRMEEALLASESKLRAVMDNSQDAIGVHVNGVWEMCNPAAVRLFGVASPADLLGTSILKVIAPAERARISEFVRQRMAGLIAPTIYLTRGLRADGNEFDMDVTLSDFVLDGKRHVLVILRDITEQKHMEEALRASEERYRTLAESAPDMIFVIDRDDQVQYVNSFAARLFNATPEQVIGRPRRELFPPEIYALHTPWLRQIFETGESVSAEGPLVLDGCPRWTTTTLVPLREANGTPVTIMGITHDITARKQTETRLARQAAQAAVINEIGQQLTAALAVDDVLARAAQLIQEQLGVQHVGIFVFNPDRTELVLRGRAGNFAHLFATDHRLKIGQGIVGWVAKHGQRLLANDVLVEPHYVNVYGETLPTRSELAVPILSAGVVQGVLDVQSSQVNAFDQDDVLTKETLANQIAVALENARLYEQIQQHARQLEHRVAERTVELQAANVRLTELDRLKDEFLSRISHELRTPLAGILISLELLESSKPEKRERYLLRLKDAAFRMRDLIEDVLMFSQLSQSTETTRFDQIDVNNWIEGRLTAWQSKCAERHLAFQLDLAFDLPRAVADAELVLQVLTRLLTNAVNYTPTGTVTIATTLRDEAGRHWVAVGVTDTGPGIASIELPHIFERFYRGHAAADYKTSGTGIGLTICREIAEKLGGRLTVETQVGVGSTFTLWLRAI